MTVEEAVLRVQFAYPRVYLACHTEHQNRRTTPERLSQRDATILAHMTATEAISHSKLAEHLGVGRPTISEAVGWLMECGYIESGLRLTARGVEAMSSSSVLERSRLELLLSQLSDDERERAVEGIKLLARAAAGVPKC